MPDLRELVRTVHATPGVSGAVAAGPDGLLIDAAGVDGDRAEHLAALATGSLRAAGSIADAAGVGEPRTVVIEGARGTVVAMPLASDVTLIALVDGESSPEAAGDAVYALRRARSQYATFA